MTHDPKTTLFGWGLRLYGILASALALYWSVTKSGLFPWIADGMASLFPWSTRISGHAFLVTWLAVLLPALAVLLIARLFGIQTRRPARSKSPGGKG